jgi:hypothetical protein
MMTDKILLGFEVASGSPVTIPLAHTVMTAYEKGFIIGLIEGEGCIRLFPHSTKHGTKKCRLPYLAIVNTDLDLLQFTEKIMQKVGVHTHIYIIPVKPTHWKTRYELRVVGYRSFEYLVPILKEGLVSNHRREQLETVLRLFEERKARYDQHENYARTVIEEIRKGKTAKQIGLEFDVSERYAYRLVQRKGLTFSKVRQS